MPAPASGTVVKIHVAEGDTVRSAPCSPRSPTENGAAPAAADRARRRRRRPRPSAEADAARSGEIVDIVTPAGGESVTEGTILEWAVKVGDTVEDGETVVEISTDKVDMELPAPAAGTITEILAEEGDDGHGRPGHRADAGRRRRRRGPTPRRAVGQRRRRHRRAAPAVPDGAKASPVAARVAAAEGVDLGASPAPARGGRITKDDVLDATNGDGAAAAGRRRAHRTLLKGGAAMLARYMDESRSIPTATSFRTITVTRWTRAASSSRTAGQKVSFTHLIAYAIALGRPAGHAGDGPPLRRRSTASRTASTTARSTSASPSTSRRRTAAAR